MGSTRLDRISVDFFFVQPSFYHFFIGFYWVFLERERAGFLLIGHLLFQVASTWCGWLDLIVDEIDGNPVDSVRRRRTVAVSALISFSLANLIWCPFKGATIESTKRLATTWTRRFVLFSIRTGSTRKYQVSIDKRVVFFCRSVSSVEIGFISATLIETRRYERFFFQFPSRRSDRFTNRFECCRLSSESYILVPSGAEPDDGENERKKSKKRRRGGGCLVQ